MISNLAELIDALRAGGYAVVPPCKSCPTGYADRATRIAVAVTGLSAEHDGADEVNALTAKGVERPVAYIERNGRIWLLADGPLVGDEAVVYLGAYRESAATEEQLDAQGALVDVLTAFYDVVQSQGADVPVAAPEEAPEAESGDDGEDE